MSDQDAFDRILAALHEASLDDSQIVHATALYTSQELQTSVAYNDGLRLLHGQNSLKVRLAGPAGSHISWSPADPVAGGDWAGPALALLTGLLPHIRQFVRVRQALVRAGALGSAMTDLLETPRLGVLHLDRRGQILAANDRARALLRHSAALSVGRCCSPAHPRGRRSSCTSNPSACRRRTTGRPT